MALSWQLTAQFTAVGGRNFLSELAKREARNEQFQFLKHTHALFSYFTRYVCGLTSYVCMCLVFDGRGGEGGTHANP